MSSQEEREAVGLALIALGDQIQALCEGAGIEMAAFVLFAEAGPLEIRSPHPKELIVQHLRIAADELEQDE